MGGYNKEETMKELKEEDTTPFYSLDTLPCRAPCANPTSLDASNSFLVSLGGVVKLDLFPHQSPPCGKKNPGKKMR